MRHSIPFYIYLVCDFGTKVRHNLVKHLKLHLRATSVGGYMEEETKRIDRDDDFIVPIITPINAPTKDDHPEKGRMAMHAKYIL